MVGRPPQMCPKMPEIKMWLRGNFLPLKYQMKEATAEGDALKSVSGEYGEHLTASLCARGAPVGLDVKGAAHPLLPPCPHRQDTRQWWAPQGERRAHAHVWGRHLPRAPSS